MKATKAGILGGLILFVWSMISWMVIPWHTKTLHSFTSETAITQSIQANAPQAQGSICSPIWSMKKHLATPAPVFLQPSVLVAYQNLYCPQHSSILQV